MSSDPPRQRSSLRCSPRTHINWNWFAGQNKAIHIINATGEDLSHNTIDSGGNYGIFSDDTAGDIQAAYLIATDVRGYGVKAAISITGDGTSNFGTSNFSGVFDHSIGTGAAVVLKNVINTQVSGQFILNNNDDIIIANSTGVIIGPFQSFGAGAQVVSVSGSTNVELLSGSIINTGHVVVGSPTISIATSVGTSVHNVTSTLIGGAIAYNNYGLSIDAASTGSSVYANNFNEQTSNPTHVLDATGVPVGCLSYPCMLAKVAPTTYSGTAGITANTIYTTTAAGLYRECASLRMTIAATAGTFQLISSSFTSDGTTGGSTVGLTSPISATVIGSLGSACMEFYIDNGSAVQWALTAASVTGSPTVRYALTLEKMQ